MKLYEVPIYVAFNAADDRDAVWVMQQYTRAARGAILATGLGEDVNEVFFDINDVEPVEVP